MIFHSITPILKNRGQPTPQHGYPSLYYNPHAEHKQSVILHKKNQKKDSTSLFRSSISSLYSYSIPIRSHSDRI